MIPNDLIVIFIEWKKNVIDVKNGQQSSDISYRLLVDSQESADRTV